MASTSKKSANEIRKAAADRKRQQRERIKNNPALLEEERQKERERWEQRKRDGKTKTINELSRREQKVQRAKWRQRNYKRKTDRQRFTSESLAQAQELMRKGLSIRATAKLMPFGETTLREALKKHRLKGGSDLPGTSRESTGNCFSLPKVKEEVIDIKDISTWIVNSKRFDLLNKDPSYLYANCIICSTHFDDSQFTSLQRNRLLDMAVPSKFSIGAPGDPHEILDSAGEEICKEVEKQMEAIAATSTKKSKETKPADQPMITKSFFRESRALLSTKTVTFSSKPRIITTQVPVSSVQSSDVVTLANTAGKSITSVGNKDQPKLIWFTKLPVSQTKTATPSVQASPTLKTYSKVHVPAKALPSPVVETTFTVVPEIEVKQEIPGTSDSTNDDFGGTGDFSYPGGYDGSQYSSTALQDSTNNSVDSYDNITYDTSYDDPPITAPPPLKRKRLADGSVARSNVRNQNSASSGDENLADNYQAFSELVVAQLKSLPPPRAAMLQMKIQELLSQAIVGTEEEEEDSGTEDEPASQDEEVDETSTKPLAEPKSPAAGDRSPSAQVSTQETESTQVETTTTTTLVTRIAQKKTQRQDFVENKENNPVSLDNVYSAFSKCIVSQLKYLPTSLAVKTQNRIQKIISDEIVKFCNTRQPTSQSKTSETKVEDVQIKEEPLDIVDSMEC